MVSDENSDNLVHKYFRGNRKHKYRLKAHICHRFCCISRYWNRVVEHINDNGNTGNKSVRTPISPMYIVSNKRTLPSLYLLHSNSNHNAQFFSSFGQHHHNGSQDTKCNDHIKDGLHHQIPLPGPR